MKLEIVMTKPPTPLKTPLRYPGGKSRAVKKIEGDFPEIVTDFREPFVGGGSVALDISQKYPDAKIWINDKYFNLYNFWVQLRDNNAQLQGILLDIKTPIEFVSKPLRKEKIPKKDWNPQILSRIEKHRDLFNRAKKDIGDEGDLVMKAAQFYILNKCSFSGLGESSSFSEQASEQNFSMKGINKLSKYADVVSRWKITNLDYAELLGNDRQQFVFLDPPYDIRDNLYGKDGEMHSGFGHERFYNEVSNCKSKWMVTYNSSEIIRERFSDYNAREWDLTYTMRSTKKYTESQKKRKELLIWNYNKGEE